MTATRHFSLGDGARGRYNTSLGNQDCGGFYPTRLTYGNPLSPALLISNHFGPMEDGNPRTGPDHNRMEVRNG